MHPLSSSDILLLWERGQSLHPIDKGLLALGTALPDSPWESLVNLPLGKRNQTLLELRVTCFGSRFAGWVSCPACQEQLEFEQDCRALMTDKAYEPDQVITVQERTYRLPTSRDLAQAAREKDPQRAALSLLESCTTSPAAPKDWSEKEIEEIGEQMALADPMAEIILSLQCDHCSYQWNEPLDIVSFLWIEIEAAARRLLLEVHSLASAYGWSEREILSLSEHRRALYLELVRA